MRLHDFFDFHAREHPENEFASQDGRSVTYAQAEAEVNRLANALCASGLEKGDRVAILSKNSIEYCLIYLGCSKAGVALAPLNYRLAPPELAYIINDSQSQLLFVAQEYLGAIDGIRDQLGTVRRYISIAQPSAAQANGRGAEAPPATWEDFAPFLASQPSTPPDRFVSENDDAYQMYTSGTTGRPKGAVLCQSAVTANTIQFNLPLEGHVGERWLIVAPVYHAAAAITVFCCLYAGGSLYIMADFIPAEVARVLSEERIAVTTLVPAMIQALLVGVPDVDKRSYDVLRLISYGGSPIAEQTLRRALDVFRCEFNQGYGMTETTAGICDLLTTDHMKALQGKPQLLVSAGRPLAGTEVRIVDENDNPVPNGMIGEIIARGPQIMRGYWNLPEATDEALRGGWMHTGDAGTMDDEGYVYIQDRTKDMVVSGGENVYPREVEEVLFKHPAVADAAVIGVPDERWGEAVKAIVVLRDGQQATADEILGFCRGKLAGYKLPRSVEFLDQLPRNPSGKVLKRELRERYWAGHTRRVAGA